MNHDRPDREHDQEHDPERVGYPVRLREGVPEPARRADVLLQQVAPDEKAYQDSSPVVSQRVREEVGRHRNEQDQRAWHLQPFCIHQPAGKGIVRMRGSDRIPLQVLV